MNETLFGKIETIIMNLEYKDDPTDRGYLAKRYREIKGKLNGNSSLEVKLFLQNFRKAIELDLEALDYLINSLNETESIKKILEEAGEKNLKELSEIIEAIRADIVTNTSS